MSAFDAILGVRSVDGGTAVRSALNRHFHLDQDPVFLSVLRFGGERFRPTCFQFSTDGDVTDPIVVLDYQDRQALITAADEFVSRLRAVLSAERQVVVPNRATVNALAQLGRGLVYIHRHDWMDQRIHDRLRSGGRLLLELDRLSKTAGHSVLLPLAETLAAHWSVLSAPFERTDLVNLDAQIEPPEGMDLFTAAQKVMEGTESVGPNMHPEFEETRVNPLYARLMDDLELVDDVEDSVWATRIRSRYTQTTRRTHELMHRVVRRERRYDETPSAATRYADDQSQVQRTLARTADLSRGYSTRESAISAAISLEQLERRQAQFDRDTALEDVLVAARASESGSVVICRVVSTDRAERTGYHRMTLRPVSMPLERVPLREPFLVGVPGRHGRHWEAMEHRDDGTFLAETVSRHRLVDIPDKGEVVACVPDDVSDFRGLNPEEVPWTHTQEHQAPESSPLNGEPVRIFVTEDDDASPSWSDERRTS